MNCFDDPLNKIVIDLITKEADIMEIVTSGNPRIWNWDIVNKRLDLTADIVDLYPECPWTPN